MCLKNAEANGSSFRRKFNRLLYGFDRSRYTYNQGVVLGGLVWLHKLTGDDELLTRGAAIIDAVLTHLLSHSDPGSAINLRQGTFARASAMQTWWQPFKLTAGLAAAWLILAIGARAVESWQLNQRIEALETASVAAFRDAFPNVQTINDLRVQAEQNIRGLRGTSGAGGGMFSLLQATAEVAGQAGDITIQSLQYRDGALYLALRGANVQSVESLRAGFARQPATTLNIESTDVGTDGVQIRASVASGAGA